MRYTTEKAVRACDIHKEIKAAAIKALENPGFFAKDEVVSKLGYGTLADSVRWDHLRRFIEDELGCELIPLAKAFFHKSEKIDKTTKRRRPAGRDDPAEVKRVPERFIAWGNGKRAFGYASVVQANGNLVVRRLVYREHVALGTYGKAKKLRGNMNVQGIKAANLPPLLEAPDEDQAA